MTHRVTGLNPVNVTFPVFVTTIEYAITSPAASTASVAAPPPTDVTDFTIDNVPALVAERGDPWEHIFGAKQDLHEILGL